MMSENDIDGIWADDLLNRRQDADFLEKFLLNRIDERKARGTTRSYVLSLDAGWGHGKSFFLDRFGKQLAAQGYIVANMNAWSDDHADDPLIAVIAAIDQALAPHIQNDVKAKERWRAVLRTGTAVAAAAAKGAAKLWLGKIIGTGVDEINEYLEVSQSQKEDAVKKGVELATSAIDKKAGQLLERFKEGQRTIKRFREQLGEFLQGVEKKGAKTPLFVLIDEVDRCRPTFAIELLERVKHIFDMDNVVFVVANNTDQLRHSVGAVYGINFDSERYLYRFFDRTYTFEDPTMNEYVSSLVSAHKISEGAFSIPPGHTLQSYISGCFQYAGISLRDAEQCLDILRSCITVWNLSVEIELAAILPMIVAHQQDIEVEPITKLVEKIEVKRRERRIQHREWIVSFKGSSNMFEGTIRPEQISGVELYNQFSNASSQSLPEANEGNSASASDAWVRRRLGIEFGSRFGNSYIANNPPYSVLRDYPALIRSAGRLLPSS